MDKSRLKSSVRLVGPMLTQAEAAHYVRYRPRDIEAWPNERRVAAKQLTQVYSLAHDEE